MFGIKKLLRLSDEGYAGLKRGVFAAVLTNLCMFLPFGVAVRIITLLLAPLAGGGAVSAWELAAWLLAGAASAALYFLAYIGEYRKTYTAAYSESGKLRVEVAEKLRRLPLSFFGKKDLSELTTNIMGDCASIEHTMSHVVPTLVATSITVTLVCALLAIFDWRMAAAMFAPLPIAFALIVLTRGFQRRFGARHVQAKLEASAQMQEYLDGIKVVKAFGLAGEKSAALKAALRAMLRQAIRFELLAGTFITLAMMVLQAGIGLVAFAGALLLTGGALSPIAFLAFTLISVKIYAPLIVILTLLPEFFYTLVSAERMQRLREEKPMSGAKETVIEEFTVELRDVSFAYGDAGEGAGVGESVGTNAGGGAGAGDASDVIKHVSLLIPQGSVTAIAGPSGSGKTTLTRLIARFWDVREGSILIGGKDIRYIDPERLMGYMAFVFQDVTLFSDTVMANIRIGRQGATDDEVRAAAKLARCDGFVSAMPRGYDTVIGENGSTLSGGERQRISIARAILKDAPIILLDEATASLDPENETQIQAALSELVRGRTVIVIAHRLRTIMGAGSIAVLDQGRLVEHGSADALLAKGGLFARMHRIQQESMGWGAGG